jgi:protein SCO1/2
MGVPDQRLKRGTSPGPFGSFLAERAPPLLSRRSLLGAGLAAAAVTSSNIIASRCHAHANAGLVTPPATPPPTRLTIDDGRSRQLRDQLTGQVTAVQRIFTSCQATCPIQGAIFAHGARTLGDEVRDAQWLSISIDPAHDDPTALRGWMARFGASTR